ncbi:MAG: NifU family protein [Chitinophagales bacterium]|nr:NifU family protein [Chitinophagales bacterium]MDW8273110.1 NifU family protein [Chitinophagales bacterium]
MYKEICSTFVIMTSQDDLLRRVEASLDTMRPYLKDDGGNVEVIGITRELEVLVKLTGSCSTCPQSYMTMRAGIETAVKQAVPEIKRVVAVNQNPEEPAA